MKHTHTLFLILLLAYNFKVDAQTNKRTGELRYSLSYKLTMQIDTASSAKRTEMTVLRAGDSTHQFLGYAYNQMDSILRARRNQGVKEINMGKIYSIIDTKPLINYKIYKNIKHPQYIHIENILLDRYSYSDSLRLNWMIEEKKRDSVNGFLCQKATTFFAGRNYVAWFTLDLPLQAAPYKFDGLPGVIIRVHDTQEHYSFELVSLYKSTGKEYLYKKDSGVHEITRTEFLQQRKNVGNKTYMELLLEDGSAQLFNLTPEDEKRLNRKAKPFILNYIELE